MSNQNKQKNIASPCVGVCTVDSDNLCEGCFRTLDEIAGWSKMDNDEKKQILVSSWQRAKAAGKVF